MLHVFFHLPLPGLTSWSRCTVKRPHVKRPLQHKASRQKAARQKAATGATKPSRLNSCDITPPRQKVTRRTHLKPKIWEFFSLLFSLFCYFSAAFCRGGLMSHALSQGDFVATVAAFWHAAFWRELYVALLTWSLLAVHRLQEVSPGKGRWKKTWSMETQVLKCGCVPVCICTLCPKNNHILIFWITLSKMNRF